MKKYKDIDPFQEEDWDEVDFGLIIKFGIYIDHQRQFVHAFEVHDGEWRSSKGLVFIGYINCVDDYEEIVKNVNTKISYLYNKINDELNDTKRMKLKIKKSFGRLSIETIRHSTFIMNPLKQYTLIIDYNPISLNLISEIKFPRKKNVSLVIQRNRVSIYFNIINGKSKLKELENNFNHTIGEHIKNLVKNKKNIDAVVENKYEIVYNKKN